MVSCGFETDWGFGNEVDMGIKSAAGGERSLDWSAARIYL